MTADSQPNSEVQALESRALEVWLENHQALKRIARQIVGESSTAEDTVQRAWFQAREHPPRRLTFAWLARVVRNLALDEVRRRDSQAAPVDLPEESWAPTDAASPEAIAVTLETYRELAGAVAELPEAQRQAVYLRYFEGRTPTELARSLGVPVATVKKRLERALDRLRSRYENPAQRGRLLAVIAMPAPSMVTGGVGQVIGVLLMKKALLTAPVADLVRTGPTSFVVRLFDLPIHTAICQYQAKLKGLSWTGCTNQHRAEVWKLLLGYLPSQARRRDTTLARKRKVSRMIRQLPKSQFHLHANCSVCLTGAGIRRLHPALLQRSRKRTHG